MRTTKVLTLIQSHSNFIVRRSHIVSLRDQYILFLEVLILKFKSQSYKSQKKYLDFLLILSYLLNPLSNQHFICETVKMHMHFTLGACFNCTSDSMGPD